MLAAVRTALDDWESGDFSWLDWDETPELARTKLGLLLGVSPELIGLVSSLSEAAATVAQTVPDGSRVLVASNEFRSNLLPWLALKHRGVDVISPVEGSTETLTERICAELVEGVHLVAVSSVVSSTGARPDLDLICRRARHVGARVFLNVTQSMGVLPLDLTRLQPDYVAAHAYKWMLAPRGCAWLAVRDDRLSDLEPVAPGWHSVDEPNRDYAGARALAVSARRLDGALPWLPWIGGNAALDMLLELDLQQLGEHVLALSRRARAGLQELDVAMESVDTESHIVRVYSARSAEILAELRREGVMASGGGESLRIGVHGFNSEQDIDRFLFGVQRIVRA